MNTILGMPIVISKGYPKMQCSPAFVQTQTPELVAKTNAWMAEFFGYSNPLKDGQIMQDKLTNTLIMNQFTFDMIQRNQRDLFFPHSIQKL